MKSKIFDKIALKLVLYLLLFSSVLTILTTFGQQYLDYRVEREYMAASIDADILQQLPELSRSVEEGNSHSIHLKLDNLLGKNGIVYVAAIVNDKIGWRRGDKIDANEKRYLNSSFPLTDSTKDSFSNGKLEVVGDTHEIWQNLTKRFIQTLIANGIKIFLIGGFTLLLVQYLITRHLEALADRLDQFDSSIPFTPIKLERRGLSKPDELDQVVSGFNAMQKRACYAYDSLAKNEQRLLLFLDATEEAIVGIDRKGVCSFANDAFLEILGLVTYEEVIEKELHELFMQSDQKIIENPTGQSLVFQSMAEGQAQQSDDASVITTGGKEIFVSLRSYPVFEDGEVTGAIVFMNDNSEKRTLLHERELLSEAVNHVQVMIIIADNENIIQYVNIGAENQTGYSRSELIGIDIFTFGDFGETPSEQIIEIKTAIKQGKQWEGVVSSRSKWGTPLMFFSVISPILDNQNKVTNIISVSREISYELGFQNELMNAKKMEAVGRLSSNFAHEFGNPLFGVRSVLKDLCGRKNIGADDKHLLLLAQDECERMRGMVKEFQQFYRDSTDGDETQSVHIIIENVLTELDSLMESHRVDYSLVFVDHTSLVYIDRGKLLLVLKNIIVNGIESMAKKGGTLNISTDLDRGYLKVMIEDDGVGIKKEQQELIFEPFFTTKPDVQGAGLGLSVAYGTMKSLGGTITFSSEEGQGAVFIVHIPLN